MATEIIRPSADGFSSPSNAWGHEANPTFARLLTNSGDTAGLDRLYSPFNNDLRTFNFGDPIDIASGDTINSVTVTVALRNFDPPQTTFNVVLRIGSTNYNHPTQITNTSQTYVNFSRAFTTNPATSSAWTLSDLNSLQAGISKTSAMGTPWRFLEVEIDYTAGGTNHTITINETLSLSDIISKAINKPILETLALDDNVSAVKSITRNIGEDIAISDVLVKSVNKALTESLSTSDTINKQIQKALSDSLSTGDSLTKSIQKELIESLSIGDSVISSITILQNVGDTLTTTDSLAKAIAKLVTDSTSLNDIVSKQVIKRIEDSIALNDNINTNSGIVKSIAESVSITDEVLKQFEKGIQDTITISDDVNTIITLIQSISESVAINDTLSKSVGKFISETIVLSDFLDNGDVTLISNISDVINISEDISKGISKALTDSIDTNDLVIPSVAELLSIADVTAVEDSISKEIRKVINDTISLDTDVITRITTINRRVKGYSINSKIVTGRKYKKM